MTPALRRLVEAVDEWAVARLKVVNRLVVIRLADRVCDALPAAQAEIARAGEGAPIPMVLHCPRCGVQHVDKPEPERGWTNPPHKSHLCHGCGLVWRPADVETVGVETIGTRGANDTPWSPPPSPAPSVEAVARAMWEAGERENAAIDDEHGGPKFHPQPWERWEGGTDGRKFRAMATAVLALLPRAAGDAEQWTARGRAADAEGERDRLDAMLVRAMEAEDPDEWMADAVALRAGQPAPPALTMFCVYCGHRAGIASAEEGVDVMEAHVKTCEARPEAGLPDKLTAADARAGRLREALLKSAERLHSLGNDPVCHRHLLVGNDVLGACPTHYCAEARAALASDAP